MGFRRRRETEQRRSDAGIISWDSTSGWVSGLSGPYREANALRSFAGGKSDRHTVDGELFDVAWCFGQRALFCGSQREVLRSWKDRSRSDPRLSSSQRVIFGRSRALAGSVSELSTLECGRCQVTHSRHPSPLILFLLRARLKFLQFGKYISDEDIGFNSQRDSIIVV